MIDIKSNVTNYEESNRVISDTLSDITSILINTLGPYGSTTIIEDRIYNHTISKDGYTVLNKLRYNNEISNTILELVRRVSRTLVREVGDGSTSSIVISNSLLQSIKKLKDKLPSKEILDYMSAIEKILEEKIMSKSIKINEDNFSVIKSIASIANNNDDKAGDLIYSIYKEIGKNGFINLESSPTISDSYDIKDGIEHSRGYISNIFVNQSNKIDCILDRPLVFMCNDILMENDLEGLCEILGNVCLANNKPLLIIAKGYDTEVVNFLKINKNQNKKLDLAAVDYAFVNNNHFKSFEDLAIYLGATIFDKNIEDSMDKDNVSKYLGSCNKIIVNENTTRFIDGFGAIETIEERVENIKEEIKKLLQLQNLKSIDIELFGLEKRISNLTCKTATLFVGGNSDLEKDTRKFLMEDAIYACRSALKHGYIHGGNLVIPRILSKDHDEISNTLKELKINNSLSSDEIDTIIYLLLEYIDLSFRYSFNSVLSNKFNKNLSETVISGMVNTCIEDDTIYNLKTDKYESIDDTKIINSCMTDIQIMKATFSIVGLIATSNQFVSSTINI